jgi:16S rRNA (cytidine1402-2'-O)-methyltransferase
VSADGSLILVGTPIGNLGDLSPRAIEVLRAADAIACEDTRHTRKLLSAASIEAKRLLAVHEHNEHHAADGIVELLRRGLTVALVTDAGMPAVSDPGERVVAAVVAAGFAVTCVPGPSAALTALAVSGLPSDRFAFEGFLPVKGAERKARVAAVGANADTTVLFEAPHRLLRTLTDLAGACGGHRRVSVSRELTKKFEETERGTFDDVLAAHQLVDTAEPRGEHVIVVAGRPTADAERDRDLSDEAVITLLRAELGSGARTKAAVDVVSSATGLPHRHVYALAVQAKVPRGLADEARGGSSGTTACP